MGLRTSVLVCVAFLNTITSVAIAYENQDDEFYSRAADEYKVEFNALFKTGYKNLGQVQSMAAFQKADLISWQIQPTVKYLFGPLTHRQLGGEQKGAVISVLWDKAFTKDGAVFLPYAYQGTWIILKTALKGAEFTLPLPYNLQYLKTQDWENCTDPDPGHQDYGSFWYYWDPQRAGCDHKVNQHYQMINPQLTKMTQQTQISYPQYNSMLSDGKMTMTFAFGYVEDVEKPNPLADDDYGMSEFRKFVSLVKQNIKGQNYKEEPIYENKYLGSVRDNQQIGYLYSYSANNIVYEIKIVAAADIDQMELFAESFSAEKDDYFGWFGHSRVGNGFDADQFAKLLKRNPQHYSVTTEYQMIYWAGCNSYSYYTKPFFDFKAKYNEQDPSGTKSLDIISNGLPSYFSLNASNAGVLLEALTHPDQPTSYQSIVNKIENKSNQFGINVLVNILGDEDNKD